MSPQGCVAYTGKGSPDSSAQRSSMTTRVREQLSVTPHPAGSFCRLS